MFENILDGLVKIQNHIRLTFNRSEKRIYKDSTHQEAKNFFSKVHQEVKNYTITNNNAPQVVVKPDNFTHNTGSFDLIFENTSQSTAIVQKLIIGGDDINIDEFSLSPQQKATKHLNVSGFKILEQKIDTPNFELVYKDFSTNKKYKTVGNINQEPRADEKYNLGKISDISFFTLKQNTSVSNLEKRLLDKLYAKYQITGSRDKWKATDAFKELGIKDGQDLSTVRDSKFIKIELDGTHECFVLTSEGIRYMDNQ